MKFFFPLSNPWSRDLISSSWEFTNGFQQVNHREQALDNFLISWENEESGNFLRKWGKWVFYFLHQSSVLQKHISTSNPAALQELMPALPPAAPWLGCVSLTRGSSILDGLPAGRGKLIPCTAVPVGLSAKDWLEARQLTPPTACSLARGYGDTSSQLNSHLCIAMKTW